MKKANTLAPPRIDQASAQETRPNIVRSARLVLAAALLASTVALNAAEPTGDRMIAEKMPGLVACWSFGEDTGTRQYALLLNMPTYDSPILVAEKSVLPYTPDTTRSNQQAQP